MGILYVNIGLIIIMFILSIINIIIVLLRSSIPNLLAGLFCLLVLSMVSLNTIDIYKSRMTEYKEQEEIERYELVYNIVENIKTDSTITNKTGLLFAIQPRVNKINDIIDENRSNYDSWWDGILYSEKIGKLEKIKIY